MTDENTSVTGIGLHFQGGTLQYTGSTPQSTNRHIRVINGNGATIDASGTGAGTLSFTNPGPNINLFDTAGTRTITLTGSNTGGNLLAIPLTNQDVNATSLLKTGTGTWVLTAANTYSGPTTINGGVLSVSSLANGGTASNIGQSTNAAGNLVLDSGTLRYTGEANASTDRLLTVGAGGGSIDSAGTGTLSFTNTGSVAFTGTGNRTLTLTGTTQGARWRR